MVISIIIPLYNKENHIRRAVQSVLDQTVSDFELLVVDDGSTDGSAKVVEKFTDTRIRLLRQENGGVSAARNFGITKAQNELIAFLDADDKWKPRFLETILELRDKYPYAGAYTTSYEIYKPNGTIVSPKYIGIPKTPWEGIIPDYYYSSLGSSPICSSVVTIPKVVFDNVGLFSVGEHMGEDLEMWFRISLKYPIAFSNFNGGTYFKDADNRLCKSGRDINGYKIISTIRNAIDDNKIPTEKIPYVLECANIKMIDSAAQCVLSGMKREARRFLKDCKTKIFIKRKIFWLFSSYLPTKLIRIIINIKRKFIN